MALNIKKADKTRADEMLMQATTAKKEPITSVSETLDKLEVADSLSQPVSPAAKPVEKAEKTKVKVEKKNETTTKMSTKKKNPDSKMGRPLNKDKGLINKKQFSATIREDIYELAQKYSVEKEVSLSKYVELALKEYLTKNEGVKF